MEKPACGMSRHTAVRAEGSIFTRKPGKESRHELLSSTTDACHPLQLSSTEVIDFTDHFCRDLSCVVVRAASQYGVTVMRTGHKSDKAT